MSRGQYEFDVWSYIAKMGIRMRPVSDNFYLAGDAVCAMRTCQYVTQTDCEEFLHVDYRDFCCSAPGCQATFSQLIDSEAHYNAVHRHSCSVCKKSLPTSHLLELHVTETHDSYFSVLSTKKPSYECFLEKCNLKFWNADDRRQHSITDHSFPTDFKFDSGDKMGKMKKKSRSKKNNGDVEKMEDEETPVISQKPESQKSKKISTKSSMDVDEAVIVSKPAAVQPPTSPPKFRPEEVRLRNSGSRPSPSHRIRPVSAFIPATIPTPDSKGDATHDKVKVPLSSRTPPTYHRRLSLNASNNAKPEQHKDVQSPPIRRAPLSLARMGERLSYYGGSSVDVSADKNDDDAPLQTSASTSNVNSGSGTLPRSRIPSPTKRFSETGASPFKNSPSSSIPSTPKKLSCEESPSKSRIPVLRSSSYRVPKNISFGFGVPKVFPMHGKKADGKHWHQVNNGKKSSVAANSIENTDFEDMKMALE